LSPVDFTCIVFRQVLIDQQHKLLSEVICPSNAQAKLHAEGGAFVPHGPGLSTSVAKQKA